MNLSDFDTLYDVCTDYSLTASADQGMDMSEFRSDARDEGIYYMDRRSNDLFYFRGPSGLEGTYI